MFAFFISSAAIYSNIMGQNSTQFEPEMINDIPP